MEVVFSNPTTEKTSFEFKDNVSDGIVNSSLVQGSFV